MHLLLRASEHMSGHLFGVYVDKLTGLDFVSSSTAMLLIQYRAAATGSQLRASRPRGQSCFHQPSNPDINQSPCS
jgi:hypothetical protein